MFNNFKLVPMYKFKKKYFRKKTLYNSGFTITELLVSSTISMLVLTAGFSLIRMTLDLNKSDEIALKLSGKIDNSLDFVVDEINSSKRVLTSISQQPSSCSRPSGEFVIGLSLPDQALDVSAYKKTNKSNTQFLRTQLNCPIIYTLVKNNNYTGKRGYSYKLMRRGPAINEKGYYIPTKINDTLVADKIRYSPIDSMICSPGWTKRTIKGIITCTDKYRKSAEIGISAETNKNYDKYNFLSKTSAGFSKIQDDDLLGNKNNLGGSAQGQPCAGCKLFGTPVTSNKITFFIDISGSMNWGRIRNKRPMDVAKEELINNIQKLNNGVKLQVIAFNHYSRKLFSSPQILNNRTRYEAIRWVSRLYAGGGTNPWAGVSESMKSQDVGQMILMSDGWTRTYGYCQHLGRYMKYSDCFKHYNDNVRSTTSTGTVQIDSVSIKNNFCAGNGWMGDLSSKNGGNCTVIR
tara:strand:- start:11116 stop:12498 length:1383 start_codon:yes stop_codon:yes gene_type:complete